MVKIRTRRYKIILLHWLAGPFSSLLFTDSSSLQIHASLLRVRISNPVSSMSLSPPNSSVIAIPTTMENSARTVSPSLDWSLIFPSLSSQLLSWCSTSGLSPWSIWVCFQGSWKVRLWMCIWAHSWWEDQHVHEGYATDWLSHHHLTSSVTQRLGVTLIFSDTLYMEAYNVEGNPNRTTALKAIGDAVSHIIVSLMSMWFLFFRWLISTVLFSSQLHTITSLKDLSLPTTVWIWECLPMETLNRMFMISWYTFIPFQTISLSSYNFVEEFDINLSISEIRHQLRNEQCC